MCETGEEVVVLEAAISSILVALLSVSLLPLPWGARVYVSLCLLGWVHRAYKSTEYGRYEKKIQLQLT